MARRVATRSPSVSASSSSQHEQSEHEELPSPRKECRKILRHLDEGDPDSGLATFREWWMLLAEGTPTAPQIMDLMSVTTRDKIDKAIRDAIKDQRIHQTCRALERCPFWKLSIFDVWGLFGPSGATSRTFLDGLLKFPRHFEDAEDALTFMHRARKQRTEGSRTKLEWKPQDLNVALQMKQEQDVPGGDSPPAPRLRPTEEEEAEEEEEEEEEEDSAGDDVALGMPEASSTARRDGRDSRAPPSNATPVTPKQRKGKERRPLADFSQWSKSMSMSIEVGRGLRQQQRRSSSLSPAPDFMPFSASNPDKTSQERSIDGDENPLDSDGDAGAIFASPSKTYSQPDTARSPRGTPPSSTFQLDEPTVFFGDSNPARKHSTRVASTIQSAAMSKRPRRDSTTSAHDPTALHPGRHLAMSLTEPLTLNHLDSWIATLSEIMKSPNSLRRCTISEMTDWIKQTLSAVGGKHAIAIQDQALEQIPVVVIDYSSGAAKINIYADDEGFQALRSAVTTHTPKVAQKPLPTMTSGSTVTEPGPRESHGVLSACVIVGVISTQKPGYATRLERVVPAVWERAIRIAHEFRAGSPETQQEVLKRCEISELPSPNCIIDPNTIPLPRSPTTHVDLLSHIFEHTTLSAVQENLTLSTEWNLVAANSRLVAKLASEVLKKNLNVPPLPDNSLREKLAQAEKDRAKYGSETEVARALEAYMTHLRSQITRPPQCSINNNGWNQIKELMVQLNGEIDQLTDEWSLFQRNVQTGFAKWCVKAMKDLGCEDMDPNDTGVFG